MNFEKVYQEYLEYAQKRHKKQGFYTITQDFKLYILPFFKSKIVNEMTKADIIDWQNYILNFNFSNGYNLKLYYTLSSFIKFCISKDYIESNIVLEVEKFPKKTEVIEHNIYTLHEFRKFRNGVENYVYKQLFNFLYFNGTRSGETLALKFSDIKGCSISITKNLQRRGKREIDTPKNLSSIRTIKISFLQYIRLLKLNIYYNLLYGVSDDYFIFGGIKPLATTTIDRYKHKACIKANIKEITIHEFRHSYTTRKIHNKVPIDYVSKSLGHSKVSTTLDIYLHQEKRKHNTFFSQIDFFTITQNLKKIISLLKHFAMF